MKNKLIISILFCIICIHGILPIVQLKSHPSEELLLKDQTSTGLIVITTIDDPIIEVAQEILKDSNHKWLVKYANDEDTIKDKIASFIGTCVVLVGHGTPEGLQLKTGVWSWITISTVYDYSPAEFFFTAACYSAQINTFSDKKTFGFTKVVDSYVAAKDIRGAISLVSGNLRTITNFQSSDHGPLYKYRNMYPRKDFVLTSYYTIKIAATNGLVDHLQRPWYEGGMGWGGSWDEDLEDFVEDSLAIFEPNFGIEFDVIEVVEFETDEGTHEGVMQNVYSSIWTDHTNSTGKKYDILLVYLTDRLTAGDSCFYDRYFAIAASFHHPWAYRTNPLWWTIGDRNVLRHEFSHIFGAWHGSDGFVPSDWYSQPSNPHHPPYFYEVGGQPWILSLMDYVECYLISHYLPDWDDHNYEIILDNAETWAFTDSNMVTWPYTDRGMNADPDGDGLNNAEEIIYGTLPYNDDTDNDGMTDGWEAGYFPALDPTVSDWYGNPDDDDLMNFYEFLNDADPTDSDSDDDTIIDGDEVFEWKTDPNKWDTDDDGMSDGWEITYYPVLNATTADATADPDDDTYTNFQEYCWGSDPTTKNAYVLSASFVYYTSTSVRTIMHFQVTFAWTYYIKIEYKIDSGSWITDTCYSGYYSVGSHYRDEYLYYRPTGGHTLYMRWSLISGAEEVIDQYEDSVYIPTKGGGQTP